MHPLFKKYTTEVAKEFFEFLVLYEDRLLGNWIPGVDITALTDWGDSRSLEESEIEELVNIFVEAKSRTND